MQSLGYEIVDVFTDRPFTGNPLAVVFGADGLATTQMQALAVEFHLSETVFVLPATVPGATYRARIFTPGAEIPFAGHPSVGAAVTQMRAGAFPPGEVTQECGAGLIPVRVYASGSATLGNGPLTLGPELDPYPLLAAAGLAAGDHLGPAPRVAGCGLEFPFLPVRPEALARARVDAAAARAAGVSDVCVFSWDAASRTSRARVFVPGLGVDEDPATGSAALALSAVLVGSGRLPGTGPASYVVRQGAEIGRPSTLRCEMSAEHGRVVSSWVGGEVMPVASGRIAVPDPG